MKKILTVLLVIAVMFTFSFSSAFAKTDFGSTSTYEAMQISDYYASSTEVNPTGAGKVGVTDYEKDNYVWQLENILNGLNEYSAVLVEEDVTAIDDADVYAGDQLADAIAVTTKAIDSVKAAKTSYDLYKIIAKYANDFGEIKTASETNAALEGEAKVTLSLDEGTYLLPGYGYFDSGDLYIGYTLSSTCDYFGDDEEDILLAWMIDNGYDTVKDMKSAGARAALEAAMEQIAIEEGFDIPDFSDNYAVVSGTSYGLNAYYEGKSLAKKVDDIAITDLDAVYELYGQVDDFVTKYLEDDFIDVSEPTGMMDVITQKLDAAINYYDAANFAGEYKTILNYKSSEILDKKDAIVAFAEKLLAFEEKYDLDFYGKNPTYLSRLYAAKNGYEVSAPKYDLSAYFTKFAKAEKEAVDDAWDALGVSLPEKLQSTDKTAFDAFVKAYDAYKAEVSKDAYEAYTGEEYVGVETEGYILAGKANLGTLEDKVDNTAVKAQQLLNNATVKVTTKALGNTKISVNAKVDADSFSAVLAAAGSGATIEYKFYQKKAANSTYKFTKTKKVNYITYTKKTLKKGTKYNFRVGVVVKDADGKVVAEKSYKASGLGIRVCK